MSVLKQHRRIGLIGGMGWPSTRDYYEQLNRNVATNVGGLSGADIALRSLNFADLLAAADLPGEVERVFEVTARELHAAGARVFGLCSNTGHLFSSTVRNLPDLEFVAMEHALADTLHDAQVTQVFLLGTLRTLTHPLFPETLAARGIEAKLPCSYVQQQLDEAIFAELEHGIVGPLTLSALDAVESDLRAQGAVDVTLACTELPAAIAKRPLPFRTWDTVQIHVQALIDASFKKVEKK
ncbi:aspartate/glutamate racemase family protein [Paraburkholderia agricolaris]|uniref:aspartate/glutamate racemase family protein n=1 Tax=Paraburkholderia agricolaris TaxID=2152888 RepID=UPI0038B7D71B